MSSRVSRPPAAAVPSAPKPTSAHPFKALLEEAKRSPKTPPGLTARQQQGAPTVKIVPVAATTASTSSTVSTAESQRAVARAGANAEAARLDTARSHHVATADEVTARGLALNDRTDETRTQRVVELIVNELLAEFEPRSPSTTVGNPVQPTSSQPDVPFGRASASSAQRPTVTAEVRANQAAALIERIDTFVKSQRPALALTLNNSLGARVEIEKLGPGRIALRLVGQNGPPDADTVNHLRDELTARGLKIGALSVA